MFLNPHIKFGKFITIFISEVYKQFIPLSREYSTCDKTLEFQSIQDICQDSKGIFRMKYDGKHLSRKSPVATHNRQKVPKREDNTHSEFVGALIIRTVVN